MAYIRLCALSILLLSSTSVRAEFSTFNDTQTHLSKVSNIDTLPSHNQKDLYMVSDDELSTYGNTAEIIRELKILKQDKALLLDYSKKLREKYKALESYYATKITDGSVSAAGVENVNSADMQVLNEEIKKLTQENQNLKTEYDALKIVEKSQKTELLSLQEASNANKQMLENLRADIEKKNSEIQVCTTELMNNQKTIAQIPEMEKEIVSLKNELLMKRSAEELLAGNVEIADTKKTLSPKESIDPVRVVSVSEVPNSNLNADVMVVEVAADKVALRAGPGMNNSSLMDIGKGARLTVEAKEGEWYRVNAPTGGRAYILSKYVRPLETGAPKFQRIKNTKMQSDKSEVVPFDPETTKPPLPQKPVKRVQTRKANQDATSAPDSISQEALALEALKKAMGKGVEGGVE